jgi:arginine exporter protein ArgO
MLNIMKNIQFRMPQKGVFWYWCWKFDIHKKNLVLLLWFGTLFILWVTFHYTKKIMKYNPKKKKKNPQIKIKKKKFDEHFQMVTKW